MHRTNCRSLSKRAWLGVKRAWLSRISPRTSFSMASSCCGLLPLLTNASRTSNMSSGRGNLYGFRSTSPSALSTQKHPGWQNRSPASVSTHVSSCNVWRRLGCWSFSHVKTLFSRSLYCGASGGRKLLTTLRRCCTTMLSSSSTSLTTCFSRPSASRFETRSFTTGVTEPTRWRYFFSHMSDGLHTAGVHARGKELG